MLGSMPSTSGRTMVPAYRQLSTNTSCFRRVPLLRTRRCLVRLASSEGDSSSTKTEDTRIRRTLADLDAILGIQEEEKPGFKANKPSEASTAISVSSEAMKKLADAEAQRLSAGNAAKTGPLRDDLEGQFQKIIEKARRLADEQSKKSGTGESSRWECVMTSRTACSQSSFSQRT